MGGGEGLLGVGFPEGLNGFLAVEKEGYIPNVKQYTVNAQGFTLPALELTPLRPLKIEVSVLETNGKNLVLRGLRDDESVYIAAYAKDKNYEDSALFPSNNYNSKNHNLDPCVLNLKLWHFLIMPQKRLPLKLFTMAPA